MHQLDGQRMDAGTGTVTELEYFTRRFSSTKNGSPVTVSNFWSGKSGWRSGMKSLTLFFLQTDRQLQTWPL